MTIRIALTVAAGLCLVPAAASAQFRGARNAPAMTADGPVYNPTQTPEWRQAGGNYEVWQQLMMQKMARQEQAAFQKQQAAFQKWAKANPAAYKAMLAQQQAAASADTAPAYRRKKKHVLKDSTDASAKAEAKSATKAATKPADAPKKDDGETATPPATATTKPAPPK